LSVGDSEIDLANWLKLMPYHPSNIVIPHTLGARDQG
jgi:hypothetical protein